MTNDPHSTPNDRPHSTATLKPEASSAISSTSPGQPEYPPTLPLSPRRVRRLGLSERNGIWRCDGPVWRAFYAWFGQDAGGWHYTVADRPYWTQTSAGVRDVDATTITSDPTKDLRLFQFDELARLGEPSYLFGPNGEALPLPRHMAKSYWREPAAADLWVDHDGEVRPLTEHGRDVLAQLDQQPSDSCAKPEPHQVNDTGYDPDCDACNAPGGPSPEHTAQHYQEETAP